jgi:lipopolysaccharide export system protein LptA
MSARRVLFVTVAGVFVALSAGARAEKADREKPINIEADRMTADDVKQVAVFEGRVVLVQGTFVLRADKLTVRQDKDGFKYGVAVGKPATFRQKRDAVDEWVDGEADRIEYDTKVEKVELFARARVTRDKDEVRGNYISYDQRTEFFQVQHAKDGGAPPNEGGRVRATFQPKPKPASPEPTSAPLELKPLGSVSTPR